MAAKSKVKAKKQNTNGVQVNGDRSSNTNHTNNGSVEHPADIGAESPLKLFGEAKDKINGLYCKLGECVGKASQFYSGDQVDEEILKSVDRGRLSQLSKSIETIRNVLSRNQMKVAFFGRTSNGKSTVINAILGDRVLPMGYGHTTGCFLQIEGNPENEAFLEVQKDGENEEKKPVQSVAHMANALNSGALEYSTLVKIHWPVSKCPLLKYDVVLVDSPGVDVEENLDEWIDEHCHDADVFVLVSNAESTLNIAEKNFFHKVSEKLSKPNIFILNNRWDSIADDPGSMEQVRAQHIERAINFLADELKISTRDEAKQRTFFVSARETLQQRSPISNNLNDSRREGYDDRNEEFEHFERFFEESLSKSAVKTKFKKHTDRGRDTINELGSILDSTQSLITQASKQRIVELRRNEASCKTIHDHFYTKESLLRTRIAEIRERIQITSESELDTEIRRLSRVVEDYEEKFSPNLDKLHHYKQGLYLHIEESLSENLKSRINSVISKHVNPFSRDMCDIGRLLSDERKQRINNIVCSQSYVQDDLFDLRIYKQFYTEFQEDLEFRFSLGIVSILRKFQSRFSPRKPNISINGNLDQSHATVSADTDFLSIMERFMMTSPQSPTTVGSLAVGGILVRTVGLRVIIITTVVYGALYAYEYLTWTNSAKERTFKAQYVRYAKKGLQDCVPIISQHIANSIEQKVATTFSKVKQEVDTESLEVKNRISLLKSSLDKLRVCEEFTTELLGENNILMTELAAFAASFLGV